LFVRAQGAGNPLSIAADRIAVPAMRAARLFSQLAARGEPVDRTGKGRVVEVYPASALRRWGLPADRYKKAKGRAVRCELIGQLESQAGSWLTLSPAVRERCQADDNSLDALVAALVARAAARGLCEAVPTELAELAAREGWIALPKPGTLQLLA
jgi:predicted RNase H-like nuclease